MDFSFHLESEGRLKLLIQVIIKRVSEVLKLGAEKLELSQLGKLETCLKTGELPQVLQLTR